MLVRFVRGGIALGEPVAEPGRTWAPTKGDERDIPDEIAQSLIDTGYAEEVKEGALSRAPSDPSVGPVETQAVGGAPENQAQRRTRAIKETPAVDEAQG